MTIYGKLCRHPAVFHAVTGLSTEAFDALYDQLVDGPPQPEHDAPPPTQATTTRHAHDSRNRLLMAVIWLHLYPTYDVLGRIFGLHRSTVGRNLKPVLEVLRQHPPDGLTWPDGTRRKLNLEGFIREYPEAVSALGFEDQTAVAQRPDVDLRLLARLPRSLQKMFVRYRLPIVQPFGGLVPQRLVDIRTRRAFDPLLGLALLYLLALTLVEAVTTLIQADIGMAMHAVLLITLLLHATLLWRHPICRLFLSLAFAPLIRLLSLALPLAQFPLIDWYLITGVPLIIAALIAVRSLGYSRQMVGLGLGRRPLLQIATAFSGLAFGYVEYQILQPAPLADALTWEALRFPALVLLTCAGFNEELIFRGIMQRAAVDTFGRSGILYTTTVFAMLHMGHRSPEDVIFAFVAGGLFGWVVYKTNSIWSVTIAHGLTNIMLFLIMPLAFA